MCGISSNQTIIIFSKFAVPTDTYHVSAEQIPEKKKTLAKKKLTRKRKLTPAEWIDKRAKTARDTGRSGQGRHGTQIFARTMNVGCLKDCRFKCSEKISNQERQGLFTKFWGLADHTRQWYYLSVHMKLLIKDSKGTDIIRENKRYEYSLEASEKKRVKVCRTMFLDTFGKT